MNIKLSTIEYNHIWNTLQAIAGKNAIAAGKVLDQIKANADQGKAESIEIEVEKYILEHVLDGLVELATKPEATYNHIQGLHFASSILKISKAFAAKLDALIPVADSTLEIDSTIELD